MAERSFRGDPGVDRREYERLFAEWLGIERTVWLGEGCVGDDTHGHIDDLARFVGPRQVVTVVESDPNEVNFAPLRENLERLHSMTDVDGSKLEIIELPMPSLVVFDRQRLPASYANFYIANEVVLLPVYDHANDAVAADTLQRLFPDRRVVPIPCEPLVWGMGAIHCVTQQQPKA